MDHLTRQDLWEAMESCRSARGELADPQFVGLAAAMDNDPELRISFDRIERADAEIQVAFAQVPMPADLAERTLTRLAATGRAATPAASVAPLGRDAAPPHSRRVFPRRLLLGVASLAASAALFAAVWVQIHRLPALTPGSAVEEAMDFFGHDADPPGQLVSVVAPPDDLPMSSELRPLSSVRWRPVKSLLGSAGVAYDLPAINGHATLYVVRRTVPGLPSLPPSVPSHSTGGNSAAVWQQGDLLYVLVVQGDAATYSQYLDRSNGPLT